MCEQCLTWPISFGTPLPGYALMRARRDGDRWLKGEWALIKVNDPTVTWRSTPVVGPKYAPGEFYDQFSRFGMHEAHSLFEACKAAGFRPGRAEHVETWLFRHLATWLTTAEQVDEGDAFPHLENTKPADLTIGRNPLPDEQQPVV